MERRVLGEAENEYKTNNMNYGKKHHSFGRSKMEAKSPPFSLGILPRDLGDWALRALFAVAILEAGGVVATRKSVSEAVDEGEARLALRAWGDVRPTRKVIASLAAEVGCPDWKGAFKMSPLLQALPAGRAERKKERGNFYL